MAHHTTSIEHLLIEPLALTTKQKDLVDGCIRVHLEVVVCNDDDSEANVIVNDNEGTVYDIDSHVDAFL